MVLQRLRTVYKLVLLLFWCRGTSLGDFIIMYLFWLDFVHSCHISKRPAQYCWQRSVAIHRSTAAIPKSAHTKIWEQASVIMRCLLRPCVCMTWL